MKGIIPFGGINIRHYPTTKGASEQPLLVRRPRWAKFYFFVTNYLLRNVLEKVLRCLEKVN
jgi:hypothetical protein